MCPKGGTWKEFRPGGEPKICVSSPPFDGTLENMKKYLKNMKRYVRNTKEYEEICGKYEGIPLII